MGNEVIRTRRNGTKFIEMGSIVAGVAGGEFSLPEPESFHPSEVQAIKVQVSNVGRSTTPESN